MEQTADRVSSALETVLARFAAMVRGVGRRHQLSDADLDEVMQEVRIRLWRASQTSEQIERLGASYVYRTATSAALDLLRRRRAHGGDATRSLDEHPHASPPDPREPHRTLEEAELADRILQALDTLPPSRRPVVRMHLAGYTREEIAELLGWSEAKTRNLLYRGLADLRARLTDLGISMDGTE
jgi:RNA polymerase sigma-70 factor (ECF subfamily)